MKRLLFASAIALVGSVVSFTACKQGLNDRCQVNEDCEVGVCNKAKGTCQSSSGGDLDADVIDAAPADAPDAL